VLEANVRALELLQAALRLSDPEHAATEGADRTRVRAEELSRRSLDRLDDVLRDLQEAAGGDTLPRNSDAREILEEARRLREEIATGIGEAERDRERARDRDREREEDRRDADATDEGIEIDVEDELDSIRAELEGDDGDQDDKVDKSDESNGSDGSDGSEEDEANES
jgi:hypothetical protein